MLSFPFFSERESESGLIFRGASRPRVELILKADYFKVGKSCQEEMGEEVGIILGLGFTIEKREVQA